MTALRDKVFGGDSPNISLDDVAETLSNERRRQLIRALEESESLTLRDLAERVAQNEESDEIDADDRKRVYIALHQAHLPRMANMNVVDYDRDRKIVGRGKEFNATAKALEKIESIFR